MCGLASGSLCILDPEKLRPDQIVHSIVMKHLSTHSSSLQPEYNISGCHLQCRRLREAQVSSLQ